MDAKCEIDSDNYIIYGHNMKTALTRGEILGCAYRDIECSPAVYYKVEGGAREFRHALAEGHYGHHLAVVYGDYVEQIKNSAKS